MFTSVRIVMRAARQWSANGDSRLGAALAYYALFSVAPLLVIAVTIAGVVFGDDAARGHVQHQLEDYIGPESAAFIQKMVESAAQPRQQEWAPYVTGVGLLLVGALGMFLHVRAGLASVWKLAPPRGNTWLLLLLDY